MPDGKGIAYARRSEGMDVGDREWGEERKTEMTVSSEMLFLDCAATKHRKDDKEGV